MATVAEKLEEIRRRKAGIESTRSDLQKNADSSPEAAADLEALNALYPPEPTCPTVHGVVYKVFPELEVFGDINSPTTDTDSLILRVVQPPSGSSTVEELKKEISSASEKAKTSIFKAATDLKTRVNEELVAIKDDYNATRDQLELAVDAALDGDLIDQSELFKMPADLVAKAFKGFKKAKDCLLGEEGSSTRKFNTKPGEINSGLSEGTGENGARIVEQYKIDKKSNKSDIETYDEYMFSVTLDYNERKLAEDEEREKYLQGQVVGSTPFEQAVKERDLQAKIKEKFPNQITKDERDAKIVELDPLGVTYFPLVETDKSRGEIFVMYKDENKVNVIDLETSVIKRVITVDEFKALDLDVTTEPVPSILSVDEFEYIDEMGQPIDLSEVFNGARIPQ